MAGQVNWRRRALLGLIGWLSATAAAATANLRTHPIRVCDDANEWPPYTYFQRENGRPTTQLTGFTVELLRRIAARHGLSLHIELLPWKRCLEAVRTGEALLLLNAIRTPERERDYWLSSPLYETRLLYLWSKRQRPDGWVLRTQADLAPLRIGGVQGYSYSQLDRIPDTSLIRAPHYPSLLQMLHLGRVDVALVNEGVMLGHTALGNPAFSADADLGIGALEDRAPSRFYMMATRARSEGQALMALINRDLEAMGRQGELDRLRDGFLLPLTPAASPPATAAKPAAPRPQAPR